MIFTPAVISHDINEIQQDKGLIGNTGTGLAQRHGGNGQQFLC